MLDKLAGQTRRGKVQHAALVLQIRLLLALLVVNQQVVLLLVQILGRDGRVHQLVAVEFLDVDYFPWDWVEVNGVLDGRLLHLEEQVRHE